MGRLTGTPLHFEQSNLGGNPWAGHAGLLSVAKIMSQCRHAYNEILRLCLTIGSLFGYGDDFMLALKKILPFITFRDDAELSRRNLTAAFEQVSKTYLDSIAEGTDSAVVKRYVLSGLCESLTLALLKKENQRKRVLVDVFAYSGANRILPDNSTNLDFAAESFSKRDTYWEVFECKQNPSQFFEPYSWSNDKDVNRQQRWRNSQIRLALAILDVGKNFASVCVICYRPGPDVGKNLRRLEKMPPSIPIYNLNDAWEKVPWCQIP